MAVPGPGVEIGPGQTKDVLGFSVTAEESSVKVQRIDVYFEPSTTTPWKVLDYVTLKAGGNPVVGMSAVKANFYDETGGVYKMRFQGFNIPIAKDGVVNFTVEVKVLATYDKFDEEPIEIRLDEKSIRAVDAVCIQIEEGSTDISRTFSAVVEGATLEVSLSEDTPEGVILASQTKDEFAEILRFDLEAEGGDVTVFGIDLTVTSTEADLDEYFTTLRLVDGDTVLDEVNVATSSSFADFEVLIAKDATKTLKVEIGIRELDSENQGFTIQASVDAVDAEDDEGEEVEVTPDAEGETLTVYVVVPSISLVSQDMVPVTGATYMAVGYIKFNVNAIGGNVFVNLGDTVVTSSVPTVDIGEDGEDWETPINATEATTSVYRITKGQTATFEVVVTLTNTSTSTAATVRALIDTLVWGADDTTTEEWTAALIDEVKSLRTKAVGLSKAE